ncbi:MAG: endonuclease [Gammaproteobacteria bacterium RIFCSPHIGHO2_12_FULL_37_14]|nr:MAG: endonuclease [Gammaproteobacteria bacterium RIFCSPHIGHO2_12_FULL_37_14]
MKSFYVYILSNAGRTLYIGVTNNLERRMYEHKNKLINGFTKKYNLTKLVHYETTWDIREAIYREKQLKGWLRSKKIALIEEGNPGWDDLSLSWRI